MPRRDFVHLSRQFLGGEDGLLKEDIGERGYPALVVTKLADDLGTERGADEAVNYATENLTERVMALTDGKGADVCFDSIGGDLFDAALSALGWGGRILLVGFVGGVQQIPANRLLVKHRAALGSSLRYFRWHAPDKLRRSVEELVRWYGEGKLRRALDLAIQEHSDVTHEAFCKLEQSTMPRIGIKDERCVRDMLLQDEGVDARHHDVVPSVHNQNRLLNLLEPSVTITDRDHSPRSDGAGLCTHGRHRGRDVLVGALVTPLPERSSCCLAALARAKKEIQKIVFGGHFLRGVLGD